MRKLEQLTFENTYTRLPEVFYQTIFPTPLQNASLRAFNPDAAALIELDPQEGQRPDATSLLMLARPWPGTWPIAQAYAGHQFGNFVPQLGDGRAILLGEVSTSQPHIWNPYRHLTTQRWDLHLKGAGKTAFSRQFDGRAVLRSCIREYLASEALHALGIPSTRALALIGSTEPVFREQPEPGAMLLRLAPTHVRFGTFEWLFHKRDFPKLQALADYLLIQHYPELTQTESPYSGLLQSIVTRTAELLAHWQAFGFTHGVMNTDNFSAIGLTLDYGPFGFLEDFNPGHVSNTTDEGGAYAFGRQPEIGFFNLQCLARALSPLMTADEAREALGQYEPTLAGCYLGLMADKLGLLKRLDDDETLIQELLALLPGTDYTLFFRHLAQFQTESPTLNLDWLNQVSSQPLRFRPWLERYRDRLRRESSQDSARRVHMNAINPKFVLRNHLAEQVIQEMTSNPQSNAVEDLRMILAKPFEEQPEHETFSRPAPAGSIPLRVSCSS